MSALHAEPDRRHRDHHHRRARRAGQHAGHAAHRRARGSAGAHQGGSVGPRGGAHLRQGRQLRRRRRHPGVHPDRLRLRGGSALPQGPGDDRPAGALPQADRRRDSRRLRGTGLRALPRLRLADRHRFSQDRDRASRGPDRHSPGAGGCQRLPRLIGVRAALDIILAGKTERAAKAFKIGLVDELVPPSILRSVALAAADRLARNGPADRKKRGSLLLERNPLGRRFVYSAAKKTVLKKTGGNYPAPLAALEAVRTGLEHGMDAGLRKEPSSSASWRWAKSPATWCGSSSPPPRSRRTTAFLPAPPPRARSAGSASSAPASWARASPAPRCPRRASRPGSRTRICPGSGRGCSPPPRSCGVSSPAAGSPSSSSSARPRSCRAAGASADSSGPTW